MILAVNRISFASSLLSFQFVNAHVFDSWESCFRFSYLVLLLSLLLIPLFYHWNHRRRCRHHHPFIISTEYDIIMWNFIVVKNTAIIVVMNAITVSAARCLRSFCSLFPLQKTAQSMNRMAEPCMDE